MATRGAQKPSICFVALKAYGLLSGRGDIQHVGGAEVQQILIARELVERGYRVSFVVLDHGQHDGEEIDGIHVFKAYRRDAGVHGVRFLYPRTTKLWSAMRRAGADVYYQRCAGSETGLVARWCGVHHRRFVFAVASDFDCDPTLPRLRRYSDRLLYEYGLRRADVVLVQTDHQQALLLQAFAVSSRVVRSCCVSPVDRDGAPDQGREFSANVLWVGRLIPEKRPEWVLDLVADFPSQRFDLVGGSTVFNSYQQALIARIEACPNVTWHGYLPPAALAPLYRRARVLLCTSVAEGFPNVFLESWRVATPVLSTVDPDDIIRRHGLGKVAPDYESLKRGLQEIADSPTKWAICASAAVHYVRRHHQPRATVDALLSALPPTGATTQPEIFSRRRRVTTVESSSESKDVHVTIIRAREQLEAHASDWDALLARSPASTLFLTWDWISAWLDTIHPEAQLFVILVHAPDGRLIGIAPFYQTRLHFLGLIPYRCLRVLGDCYTAAEYPDVVVRHGFETRCLHEIVRVLCVHQSEWDCLWMPAAATWMGTTSQLAEICSAQGLYVHRRPHDFSVVALPDTYDAYFKSLSSNTRSTLKRRSKRLLASHELELVRCRRPEELPRFLDALFALHKSRWNAVGQLGSFVRKPRASAFYRRFAPVALSKGWLRLYGLSVDGQIMAVQYGYAYEGVFHQVQEGFDPNSIPGIGNVLRGLVFEACINEGLHAYDFLGGFTDHKRRWAAKVRAGHDLFIGRRSVKNAVLFGQQFWPTGRYISEDSPAVRAGREFYQLRRAIL